MRYKILFISSWFPNKIEPTNGNFVQRHAEAVSLLHDVEILHTIGVPNQNQTYVFDNQIINGIRTLIVYYKNTNNPLLNFSRRMNAYRKGFSQMQIPDLVHANVLQKSMLFAVYLKKKYDIPFVITEHWSGFLNINSTQLSGIQLFLAKIIAKNAAYILPVSHFLEKDLKKLGFSTRMKVIGNVVDTDLFYLKEAKNLEFVFLHISNLIPLKNPEKIIEAAIQLRTNFNNFELHIGGDGDVENLNKIIRQNSAEDYIKTFPILTLPEVAEKMQNSDCFILFSDYESFGCVLLESLSTGTPVIATNAGAVPEIITIGNGVLIKNSTKELYEAMEQILQHKIVFNSKQELHQFVDDHFSRKVIAEKFDQIYQLILRK